MKHMKNKTRYEALPSHELSKNIIISHYGHFVQGMDPYPVGMDPYPVGMVPYPVGMDSYPLGMDSYPVSFINL